MKFANTAWFIIGANVACFALAGVPAIASGSVPGALGAGLNLLVAVSFYLSVRDSED